MTTPMISNRSRTLDLIQQPHELLTLPERFLEIRSFLSSHRANADTLAYIIETDLATAATLLKVANSSAYNPLGKPLASLPKAIARLGLATSAQIAMSMSLLQGIRLPIALQHIRQFWAHSFAVSQLCLRMSEELNDQAKKDLSDLFMAALFHDIGRILITLHVDALYFQRDFFNFHGAELCQEERRVYGMDHAEVGQHVLMQWGMPESLIYVVAHHHEESGDVAAMLCSLADQFVHEHWPTLQYIDAAQSMVHELSVDEVRAIFQAAPSLLPLLKEA